MPGILRHAFGFIGVLRTFFLWPRTKRRAKKYSRFASLRFTHSIGRALSAFAHGTAKKWQKINKNRSASFFAEPSLPTHFPKALNPASFIRSSPLRYTSNIFCHAFRARLLSVIPFVPHFIPSSKQSHTKKKCLHYFLPALYFAGGKSAGKKCFLSAPFGRPPSPAPPRGRPPGRLLADSAQDA